MKDNWSGRQTLAIMFLGTIIGLILWLILMYFLHLLLQNMGFSVDFWAMTEAMSTAAAAAAVIGGGLVAYRQLMEGANMRYIEVADRLFSELNSSDNIASRRWIFQQLPENPENPAEILHNMNAEGQGHIKRTLNSMDRVAFLTQSGWIPEELIMPWMNPMIVKAWVKLKPYVEYERERRGEPDYYKDAGEIGEKCVAWRNQHLEQSEVKFLEKAL
jgi:hypothetical protein